MASKAVVKPNPTPNCISRNTEPSTAIQKTVLQPAYQFKLVLPVNLKEI